MLSIGTCIGIMCWNVTRETTSVKSIDYKGISRVKECEECLTNIWSIKERTTSPPMKLGGIELFNKTDLYEGVSFLRNEQILHGYRSNFLRNAIPYGYKYIPNSPKVSQSSSSLWSVFSQSSSILHSVFVQSSSNPYSPVHTVFRRLRGL